jgi:DNA-binding transcriptional regulator PaaX
MMSSLYTTDQNVLRAFARQIGWSQLVDVVTELREVGYEPRKIVAAVRRLLALGLLRSSSAERCEYQLTDEGRKALAI